MDALAVGAFVALWVRGPRGLMPALRASGPVLVGSVLVLVCLAVVTLGPMSYLARPQQTIGYTLWALAFAALVVQAVAYPDGPLARVLRWRPLVETGQISYGLYLLHCPILFIVRQTGVSELGFVPFAVITVAASFGLAFLSWRYFERPLLRLKRFFPYEKTSAELASGSRQQRGSITSAPSPAIMSGVDSVSTTA